MIEDAADISTRAAKQGFAHGKGMPPKICTQGPALPQNLGRGIIFRVLSQGA